MIDESFTVRTLLRTHLVWWVRNILGQLKCADWLGNIHLSKNKLNKKECEDVKKILRKQYF